MDIPDKQIKGRGAASNPTNRFEKLSLERNEEFDDSEERPLRTEFLKDSTSTIITYNNSPDVGFDASINVYRGCEHGCVYCFARPTHEYLGFSSGLDFESRILVKENAPELLHKELGAKGWKPQILAMSGVTDCYQPIEKQLGLTRKCLAVLLEYRNPVIIITKNHLVTRDIDLLAQLAKFKAVAVHISVTTLDAKLTPKLEPRASLPAMRLEAIRKLSDAGVPVGVLAAPMIPGLTDHEMPRIIQECAKAGAQYAGYVPLRLPFGLKDLFEQWLERHFPDSKEKVLSRIRSIRDGKLNDSNFGTRMEGTGNYAEQLNQMFHAAARKAGLEGRRSEVTASNFKRPGPEQLKLF